MTSTNKILAVIAVLLAIIAGKLLNFSGKDIAEIILLLLIFGIPSFLFACAVACNLNNNKPPTAFRLIVGVLVGWIIFLGIPLVLRFSQKINLFYDWLGSSVWLSIPACLIWLAISAGILATHTNEYASNTK